MTIKIMQGWIVDRPEVTANARYALETPATEIAKQFNAVSSTLWPSDRSTT